MKELIIFAALSASVFFMGDKADIQSLESKYGVSIDRAWMGYSITAPVHGEHPQIAQAKISSSRAELEQQLQTLYENKISDLEKTFSVKIARFGTVNETAYGQMHQTAHAVPVRSPKLGELYVLEYALEHSEPSQLMNFSRNPAGINIYFLDQKNPFTATEWGFNSAGKPAVFIEPRLGVTFGHTLEENVMHQLAHNSAYKLGWNPNESWNWPLAKKLGFEFSGKPHLTEFTLNGHTRTIGSPGPYAWLLKTSEGFLYRNTQPDLWIRCSKDLIPLDDMGKPVAASKARKLSSDRIREYALVKPLSLDFPTPPEVFADALSMFRADRDSRAELLQISPILYKVVREHDQEELDKTYGKGNKVRAVDGTVTEPTLPIIREIRDLEEGVPS